MAQPSNTFDTYDSIGNREDLSDIISRIDPSSTPFMSNIGRTDVSATKHEWQKQDLLAASDANAVIDGDDATLDAVTPTVRVGNFTQISDKTAVISGTTEAIDRAGRGGEMAYQIVLKGLELNRDVEKQMLSNKPSVAGNSTLARQSAGLEAWLETNTSRNTTTAADGGYNSGTGVVDAATDGSATRTFTEALVKTVLSSCFSNGGKPTMALMSGTLKQTFSTFSGIAAQRFPVSGDQMGSIIGAADVYVSDFGNLSIVPHAYGTRATSCLLIDPSKVSKGVLRGMQDFELAKNGDNEKRQVLEEYTTVVENEAAHGIVADLG